jgi:preprotein translocase subunit SecE
MTVMEMKKSQAATSESIASPAKKAQSVLSEVKAEIGRITWTSKDELITYTKIVVGSTILLGLGIYFVDLTIQSVFQGFHYILSLVI